ncbi:MAG: clostripain-related cysteine peptidase [Thermoplasmata archaeon]
MTRRAAALAAVAAFAVLLSGCTGPSLNHPPVVESFEPSGSPALPEGGCVTFRVVAKDPDGGRLRCSWYIDGVLNCTSAPPFVFVYHPGRAVGEHTVTAVISDGYLTARHEWNVTVMRVNHPPTFIRTDPPAGSLTVSEGYALELAVEVADADGDPVVLSWFADEVHIGQGRSSFRFETDYTMAGEHRVRVVASDGSALCEAVWSITVLDVNRAPRVVWRSPEGGVKIRELESVEFSLEAVDDDGDPVSVVWYLDGAVAGTGERWLYTTDYYSHGGHTVRASASDGLLETGVEWRVTVDNLNRPPVISQVKPEVEEVATGEYEPLRLSVWGWDEDGDPLSVRWFVDNASDPTAYGWSFDYVPGYNALGNHTVRAELSDGADTASRSWTVRALRRTALWTVLVYMCADSDLEPYLIEDINEMESVGSDANISVVAQLDRHPNYDASSGDWSEARRYRIERDGEMGSIGSRLLQSLGEVNTGSEQTLQDFLLWGLEHFPAKNYMLVIGGHGDGWPGILQDFSDGNSRISTEGVASAVRAFAEVRGAPLDVLHLDVCYWAMLETGWPLRGSVQYIVGSEDIDPSTGQSYDELLKKLGARPSMDAGELAVEAVRTFAEAYTDGKPWPEDNETFTISAVGADALEEVALRLDNLSRVLMGSLSPLSPAIAEARMRVEPYGKPDYMDLHHFVRELRSRSSSDSLNASADALISAIDSAVALSISGAQRPNSRGISIFFPRNPSGYKSSYTSLALSASHLWDDFLRAYHGVGGRGGGPRGGDGGGCSLPARGVGGREADGKQHWTMDNLGGRCCGAAESAVSKGGLGLQVVGGPSGRPSEFQFSSEHRQPSRPRVCAVSPPTASSSPPSASPPPGGASPPRWGPPPGRARLGAPPP